MAFWGIVLKNSFQCVDSGDDPLCSIQKLGLQPKYDTRFAGDCWQL